MDLKLQSITITMLAWGLVQNITQEDDRSKVRFVDVDLTNENEEYINAINFFIKNGFIETTEDKSIYVPTEWFYNAAKDYVNKYS